MGKVHTGQRLKAIMRERNMKQVDILNLVKPYSAINGIKVSKQDLSHYINEKVEPNQWKLSVLAQALDVSEAWLMGFDVPMSRQKVSDVVLNDDQKENKILSIYKQLEAPRQRVVDNVALEQLAEQNAHLSEIAVEFEHDGVKQSIDKSVIDFVTYRNKKEGILKFVSMAKTSAGSGVMLYDDSEMMEIMFPEEEVYDGSSAVTGVIVKGDSMEPKYHDGDLLWIDSRQLVDSGQIGVFVVEGESYVKKKGHNKLISLNSKYDDILIDEHTEFSIVGKVVDFTPKSVFEYVENIKWD